MFNRLKDTEREKREKIETDGEDIEKKDRQTQRLRGGEKGRGMRSEI